MYELAKHSSFTAQKPVLGMQRLIDAGPPPVDKPH
jgi:hypothetical protein